MSARSVCNGTRPSRYHSVRAISAPPKRPATLTRIPRAPIRIAFCTARFIARRNETRRSSCCEMDSPTSAASNSGLRTSTMLRCNSEAVKFASFLRRPSMSAPFLPMITPGRAVWIVTRHFLCGRSMITREIPAWTHSFLMNSRIFRSSRSRFPKSLVSAYQRLSQVRLT